MQLLGHSGLEETSFVSGSEGRKLDFKQILRKTNIHHFDLQKDCHEDLRNTGDTKEKANKIK